MRWRVGRNPTPRNSARTSCHGQPLRSSRAGGASRTGSAPAVEKTMVLGRAIRLARLAQNASKLLQLQSYPLGFAVATPLQERQACANGPNRRAATAAKRRAPVVTKVVGLCYKSTR